MIQSIRTKLIVFVSVIVLLTVGTQVFSNLFLVKSYFINEKNRQIESMFKEIQISILEHADIEEAMQHYVEDENINVTIWDQNGSTLLNKSQLDLQPYYEDLSLFVLSPLVQHRSHPHLERESLMLFGRIDLDSNKVFIILDSPISAVERSVQLISQFNLVIAVLSLIVGSTLTWFWSKRFVQPIEAIDEVAVRVSKLDFSKTVSGPYSSDEIGRLAINVNTMSNQLSTMIHDMKVSNEQLEDLVKKQKQVDAMRKDFIANVSHELKSPLGLLVMYCENLKNDLPNIDKNFYYDVIIDESQRLSDLVKKLLDIASLENGLARMNFETIDMTEFVRRICSKKSLQFEKNKTALELILESNHPILGDPFYLEQAVTNYLDNALRHSKANSTIQVFTKIDNGMLYFSVYNQGNNIPQDSLSKIWESFYKTDTAHTRSNETHAGLGLYIVKTIIQAHNGQFGVTNHDNGVSFWFRLPLNALESD